MVAIPTSGEPKAYMRFGRGPTGSWYNSGSSPDAVTWIPNKDVTIFGFSTWAAKEASDYEIKYEVELDGSRILQKDTHRVSNFVDKKCRLMFDEPIELLSGKRLVTRIWVAADMSSNRDVQTWSGESGGDHATRDNPDKGLFRVESASNSGNCTNESRGQIPEILYDLS